MLAESRTSSIMRRKVLVVEGHDGALLVDELLKHLGLSDTIDVRDFRGVSELTDYLDTLVITPGYQDIDTLAILRDAESDAQSAFASVCASLRHAQISVPNNPMAFIRGRPRVGVFILPDCTNPGMLESLCLHAVQSDAAMPCVAKYFDCIRESGVPMPTNTDKAYLHAFLASRPRPQLSLVSAAWAG